MSAPPRADGDPLGRLESRHQELLARLDELDARVVAALEQFSPPRGGGASARSSGEASAATGSQGE